MNYVQPRINCKHLLLACIVFMIIIYLTFMFRIQHDEYYALPLNIFRDEGYFDGIEPRMRTNILFLKTHKVGGTTLQNILLRFAIRNGLKVMLPEAGPYIGYSSPITNRTLSSRSMPVDGKFNVFACHSRYHPNTLKFMYNDTIRITMLREPFKHFESVYNYNHLSSRYKLTLTELVRSLPNVPTNLERRNGRKIGLNQMSYDLGLSVHQPNDTVIENFVQYIDEQFDFVLITDRYDESLVLLADLMGWPLEYVMYLPLRVRKEKQVSLFTKEEVEKVRNLERADSRLYDYFLEKFLQRTLEYGRARLDADVRALRQLNEDLYTRCGITEVREGGTIRYNTKQDPEWDCVYAARPGAKYFEEIRAEQIKRFEKEKIGLRKC